MSASTDTIMAMEYRKGIIRNNISIDTCKECRFVIIKNDKVHCNNTMPDTESCNLLKIFYNT